MVLKELGGDRWKCLSLNLYLECFFGGKFNIAASSQGQMLGNFGQD